MIVERIFGLLFNSPLQTLYAFACTIILCVIFQIVFFRRAKKKAGEKLSWRHFVLTFVFFVYLLILYLVTGMGTIWDIRWNGVFGQFSNIYWIPFIDYEQFGGGVMDNVVSHLLNVLMTVPLGFLLPLIWSGFRSFKKVVLTGFFFSLAIELSQLLSVRVTTTEDLITNTLWVVVGYLIFEFFYRIFTKKKLEKVKRELSSPVIKYEAVFYLVFSFMGMFLFYNSMAGLGGDKYEFSENTIIIKNADGEIIDEKHKRETEDSLNGFLREISSDILVIEELEVFEGEKGIIRITTDKQTMVSIGEATFEIWQTSEWETMELLPAMVDDLHVRDNLEIYGKYKGDVFVAEKIVIWR